MNSYKKTIMALGIALVLIPQIGNALDEDGVAITGALKTVIQILSCQIKY